MRQALSRLQPLLHPRVSTAGFMFIVWLSEGYERAFGLDTGCLAAGRGAPLSHDNLFHSMLGLLDVQTGVYDPGLDFSAGCRRQGRFAWAGTRPHDS